MQRLWKTEPLTTAICAMLLAFVLAAPMPAQESQLPELPWRLDITAMNTGGFGPRSARLELRVTRWTTDEERAALQEVVRQGGRRTLPEALFREESVGRLREIRGIGQEMRYARLVPREDGSYQIIIATDRPLSFVEAWRGSRTRDYNVTVMILDMGANGRGEGILMVGAEITYNEDVGQVSVEHLTTQPIRLTQVRLR